MIYKHFWSSLSSYLKYFSLQAESQKACVTLEKDLSVLIDMVLYHRCLQWKLMQNTYLVDDFSHYKVGHCFWEFQHHNNLIFYF